MIRRLLWWRGIRAGPRSRPAFDARLSSARCRRDERLDFGPGWQATNDNLVELVDLFGEARLDWTPQPTEWSARTIYAHIIGARYHGPIPEHDEWTHKGAVIENCATAEGIERSCKSRGS